MSTFLSIGKKDINYEDFHSIKNQSNKPYGGLWATKHDIKYISYNEWMDFLISNPNILFYKYIKNSNFSIPAVFIMLKNNAKILNINSLSDYLDAKEKYAKEGSLFDFEKIAKNYDGVFIKTTNLLKEIPDSMDKETLKKYDVNTLLLFNLNVIDYYQEAVIDIMPFDCEICNECIEYEIKINSERKRISNNNAVVRKRIK